MMFRVERHRCHSSLPLPVRTIIFITVVTVFLLTTRIRHQDVVAPISPLLVVCNGRSSRHDDDDVSKPVLRFRPEDDEGGTQSYYKFKILQIADIHLGEAEYTEWGPEQDFHTWRVLDTVLTLESPDLIVLSGDQLTANNCRNNATEYYRLLGDFLSRYGIPWAMIFGNHDDMDYEIPGTKNQTLPHKFGRDDLLHVDQSFPLSLSQSGPKNVAGTTNYVLDVFLQDKNQEEDTTLATQLFFLDSGGGSLRQAIDDSQIDWLKERFAVAPTGLPAVAFQHIPTVQHQEAFSSSVCQGRKEEGVAVLEYDAGIVDVLQETGRFAFLAVGHNHGNDYCCPYKSEEHVMHLCFGRHSGYGGYGTWTRGSRLYELTLIPSSITSASAEPRRGGRSGIVGDPNGDGFSLDWKSWVRLESGKVLDPVSRFQKNEV